MTIPDIRIAVKLLKNFRVGMDEPRLLEQAAVIIYANGIKPIYAVSAIKNLINPPGEGGQQYAQEYINQQIEDIVRTLHRRKAGLY